MDGNSVAIQGYVENYAEYETLLKSILSYHPSDTLKTAVGVEFEYDRITEPWGTYDPLMFIADDGVDYYASTSAVSTINPNGTRWLAGSQRYTTTHLTCTTALFSAKPPTALTPKLDMMVSARADQNVYSKLAFSPRLAFIYNADNNGIFRLLAHSVRSVRILCCNCMRPIISATRCLDDETYNDVELGWNKKTRTYGLTP